MALRGASGDGTHAFRLTTLSLPIKSRFKHKLLPHKLLCKSFIGNFAREHPGFLRSRPSVMRLKGIRGTASQCTAATGGDSLLERTNLPFEMLLRGRAVEND